MLVDFWIQYWNDILLIAVGLIALLIYELQKIDAMRNAACMIVLQIDELQERMREIRGYVAIDKFDSVAFYRSPLLINANYWDLYKHMFIRKISNEDFKALDRFYRYVNEVQEQQVQIKRLQKDMFWEKQKIMSETENELIKKTLSDINSYCQINDVNQELNFHISDEFYFDCFKNLYSLRHDKYSKIINGNSLTQYSPMEFQNTLNIIFSQYELTDISNSNGYHFLRRKAGLKR